MNVKLRVLSAGVLFFIGQSAMAQKVKKDTTKSKDIDEVVILGYSKIITKPKDVTANVVVSSERLEGRPNVSFLNSLQGSTPGVTISSFSGSPGSSKIDVIIRGISSMNASTEPLFVVDGMPTNASQFRNLNAEDIEAVSILKDAAATSIYGNRGANGVVLIKTKQGKYNRTFKLAYSTTTGISTMAKNRYNLANSQEYLTIQQRLGVKSALALTPEQIAATPTTDWVKEFFHTDITQQHNLSASFGGENANVYSSIGYLKQGGMVPNTDFQRFTFRNNINGKSANNKLTYQVQVGLSYSQRNQLNEEDNSNVYNNSIQNPLLAAVVGPPNVRPNQYQTGRDLYNAIGGTTAGANSVLVLQDVLRNGNTPRYYTELGIATNLSATYKLTDKWSVSHRSSIDHRQNDFYSASNPNSYLGILNAMNTANKITPNPYGGWEGISNSKDFTYDGVTSTTYKLSFGDHKIDVSAYFEYLKVHYKTSNRTQNGLDPRQWVLGSGTGYIGVSNVTGDALRYVPTVGAGSIKAGAISYFGTLDYDYKGKYGFSGLVRRDASYRFTDENKWATFWSVAGRWNIDQEEFMKNSGFEMLKLRASYGTQGNQNIAGDGTNPMILSPNLIRDTFSVSTGYNNQQGIGVSTVANPFIVWEQVAMSNLGLDFALLKGKLEGNIDVYNKVTTNLYNNLYSSATNGYYSYNGNYGKMQNRGIEVYLKYNIIRKQDLKLSVFANGALNDNKIKDIKVPVLTGSLVYENGGTYAQWNLAPYLGVNKANGNQTFLDRDGNVTEVPVEADRRRTGKSYLPKYNGGFGLNASYKGFFLDALFSFQAGVWKQDNLLIWASTPSYAVNGRNVVSEMMNAWTPTNTDSNFPALTAKDYSSFSDRYLFDASFIRLKSFTVGYSVPMKDIDKKFISGLKVFIQGENLVTWTKFPGFDPEGLTTFQLSKYPNPRTISFGATIDF